MYEGEKGQQEAKIAKMKEDGVDEYDVRKQEEVLAETVMMIPERRLALESASDDLKDLLVRQAPEDHAARFPASCPQPCPPLHFQAPGVVSEMRRAGRGRCRRTWRLRRDHFSEGVPQYGGRNA